MGQILRRIAAGLRSTRERPFAHIVGSTDAARAWLSRGGLRPMERPVPPSGAKAGRFSCLGFWAGCVEKSGDRPMGGIADCQISQCIEQLADGRGECNMLLHAR